ncbi:MAG: biotin transporter BioY [Firmicutes bacterium]|nr:biotin transporter BioY [Bacillota bacterium]
MSDNPKKPCRRPFLTLREMCRIAVFTALICALSPIAIPIGAVPITLQTFVILCTGVVAGPKNGTVACVAYVLLGAFGVPVFSLGRGGFGMIAGPTGGFILSFPLMALIAGLGARQMHRGQGSGVRGQLREDGLGDRGQGSGVVVGRGLAPAVEPVDPQNTPNPEPRTSNPEKGAGIGDMRHPLPVPCALCPDTLSPNPPGTEEKLSNTTVPVTTIPNPEPRAPSPESGIPITSILLLTAGILTAIAVNHLCGAFFYAAQAGVDLKIAFGAASFPYIPLDLAKGAAAGFTGASLRNALIKARLL